jgi:membrane protein DedA with SNARE-associated domain
MNGLGGICWASLFGGGAYLFGEQIKRVAGPVGLLLLVAAIGMAVAGIVFFRRHEKDLEQRAQAALPGPLSERRF